MWEGALSPLHVWRLTSPWQRISTQCLAFLVLGALQTWGDLGAGLHITRLFLLKCQRLGLPEVSPSCGARGYWWQGNRFFCYGQDPSSRLLWGSPTSSQIVTGMQPASLPYTSAQFKGWAVKGSGCRLVTLLHVTPSHAHPVPTKKSLTGCRAAEQCALFRLSLKQQQATYSWRCQANPSKILELFTYLQHN